MSVRKAQDPGAVVLWGLVDSYARALRVICSHLGIVVTCFCGNKYDEITYVDFAVLVSEACFAPSLG